MEFVSRFYSKANSLFVLNCTCKWSGFGRLREITEAQAILSHHLAPLLLEKLGLSPEIDEKKKKSARFFALLKERKKIINSGERQAFPWDSSERKQEEAGESGHRRISQGTRVFRMGDRMPRAQRSGLGSKQVRLRKREGEEQKAEQRDPEKSLRPQCRCGGPQRRLRAGRGSGL